MESSWASLKKQLVYHESYTTIEVAKARWFDSIEVFDNRQRRYSASDDRSPAEFEGTERS